MHSLASFNGKLFPSSDPTISAFSSAAQYGKGIFTTIRIHDRAPFLWNKHWRRLRENAEAVGIDLSKFSESSLEAALTELIKANDVRSGRARLTIFDETPSRLWGHRQERELSLLIACADLNSIHERYRIEVSRFTINRSSPLTGVKSCNYLEKMMALDESRGRGFDEAIQLNDRGEITSATMANIFWTREGRLFTPSLETGCLAGTTREYVLENLECDEVIAPVGELKNADEIFLTSAGIGIVEVAEFDGRELGRKEHPIMKLLAVKI